MAAFVVKLDPNFKQENNTDAENSQAITRWGAGKRWGYAYVE